MRVGNFSLLIPEGVERSSGHVHLPHGTVYRLRLGNHRHEGRCDVAVTIDGKYVGCYRIERGGTITLERSSSDEGRFTFLRSSSEEAAQAGVAEVDRADKGVVRAVFKVERKVVRSPSVIRGMSLRSDMKGGLRGQSIGGGVASFAPEESIKTCGLESGITGLTGRSDQSFYSVAPLDYDPALETTICVRLVADESVVKVRKLEPVWSMTPAPVD